MITIIIDGPPKEGNNGAGGGERRELFMKIFKVHLLLCLLLFFICDPYSHFLEETLAHIIHLLYTTALCVEPAACCVVHRPPTVSFSHSCTNKHLLLLSLSSFEFVVVSDPLEMLSRFCCTFLHHHPPLLCHPTRSADCVKHCVMHFIITSFSCKTWCLEII